MRFIIPQLIQPIPHGDIIAPYMLHIIRILATQSEGTFPKDTCGILPRQVHPRGG